MSDILDFLHHVLPDHRNPEECPADPGIDVLLAVIRITARITRNTSAVLVANVSPAALLFAYGVLIPDLYRLIMDYEDLPCEIAALTPERYMRLLTAVVAEFGMGDGQARHMIDAAVSVLGGNEAVSHMVDGANAMTPKIESLIKAVSEYTGF